MIKTYFRLLPALALSLPLIPLNAQSQQATNPSPFTEIVVVASQVPQPLVRTGTSVSTLSADEIRAHGNFALSDVLRQLPAVAASNAGGTG